MLAGWESRPETGDRKPPRVRGFGCDRDPLARSSERNAKIVADSEPGDRGRANQLRPREPGLTETRARVKTLPVPFYHPRSSTCHLEHDASDSVFLDVKEVRFE